MRTYQIAPVQRVFLRYLVSVGREVYSRPRFQQTPCFGIASPLQHPHTGVCSTLELKGLNGTPWFSSGIINESGMQLTPLQQDFPLSEYTNAAGSPKGDDRDPSVREVRKPHYSSRRSNTNIQDEHQLCVKARHVCSGWKLVAESKWIDGPDSSVYYKALTFAPKKRMCAGLARHASRRERALA